jgi:hypothetical protein
MMSPHSSQRKLPKETSKERVFNRKERKEFTQRTQGFKFELFSSLRLWRKTFASLRLKG